MPPATDTPDPAALETRYLAMLREYDDRAVQYKSWRLRLWWVTLGTIFVPLFLGVAGLGGHLNRWLGSHAEHLVLEWVIRVFHVLHVLLILANVFFSIRGQWLKHRAAAERLRGQGMLYRVGANPYDGRDPDRRFDKYLTDMDREMTEPSKVWWRVLWDRLRTRDTRTRAALGLEPLSPADSPPDRGLLPRGPAAGPDAHRLAAFERLDNQRAWHLRKAGRFYRFYLYFQGALLANTVGTAAYLYFVGHSFEQVIVSGAINLMLTAARDFHEHGPLSLRYAQLADTLRRVRVEFSQALEERRGDPEAQARVAARLAIAVEARLANEFNAWFLVQTTNPEE